MDHEHELSRTADAARILLGGKDHYPVKRRGERRRLSPNTEGIAWLDARAKRDAEITWECGLNDQGEMVAADSATAALILQRGNFVWDHYRPAPRYLRAMIQSLPAAPDQIGGDTMFCSDPCPNCYDFSYAWSCPHHPAGGRKDAFTTRPGGDRAGDSRVARARAQAVSRAALRHEWVVASFDLSSNNSFTLSWEVDPS